MKRNLLISIWMTLATTMLLGIIYPLVVTGLAQVLYRHRANGDLIEFRGQLVGSRLIGQPFTAPWYFHPRPSAAGPAGYDPTQSQGSNLAPTNKALLDRVSASVQTLQAENPNTPIPIDLVTTSASGLDPDISPASAEFQIARVARERKMTETDLRSVVQRHTQQRQFGILGEPRVNVLELNIDLDEIHAMH
ncbi:MAG: potassium-transporting ATPase subunit KdpC [Candidatus Acidiferrales bacterium]